MNLLQLPKQKRQTSQQTFAKVLNSPPRDKSLTHRALLLAALSQGTSTIDYPLWSEDTFSTLTCLKKLGLQYKKKKNSITITGNPALFYQAKNLVLNCKNSGTTIRHLLALLVGSQGNVILKGDKSLSLRPMERILTPLQIWGGHFERPKTKSKTLPLKITGAKKLRGGTYMLPIASAQVKSALLFYALLYKKILTIKGKIQSRNHTENFFKYLKIPIHITPKKISMNAAQKIPSFSVQIPADPSSTIYYLFLYNFSTLKNSPNKTQKLIMDTHYYNYTRCLSWHLLKSVGYKIEFIKYPKQNSVECIGTLEFEASQKLKKGFHILEKQTSYVIDDIPLLMIWSLFLPKKSTFEGLQELQHKESNRLLEIQKILACFGLEKYFFQDRDKVIIQPLKNFPHTMKLKKKYKGDDHRLVMIYHALLHIFGLKQKLTTKEKKIIAVSNPQWESDLETILS
jgi:3-phosphoshikimate 1-carboxyvinyltransferase